MCIGGIFSKRELHSAQVREKAESLGVISSASQEAEMRAEDAVPKKLKAPDKDTMMVTVPARKDGPMKRDRSSSIGPIWNDSADRSTSKEDSQVRWTLHSLSCLLGGMRSASKQAGKGASG